MLSRLTMSSTVEPEIGTQSSKVGLKRTDSLADQSDNSILLHEGSPSGLIDSAAGIAGVVDTIASLPTSPAIPKLFLDLEGTNLARNGTIAILQIHIASAGPTGEYKGGNTYLLDIHTLGALAFSTPGLTDSGRNLKGILEDATIPKVFFDVRNDSDALYALYQINLSGIHDLQLMELASRSFSRRCVNGLTKCIERDLSMSFTERQTCMAVKEKGLKLFAPERGGSYAVFEARPMAEELVRYCVQDVRYLPRLWAIYETRLASAWRGKVAIATMDRIVLSQSVGFNGKGRHMALGPWN